MKKLILAAALLFSGSTYAACTLQDATVVDLCQQFDANANVLIEWKNPSTYTIGDPMPSSDIGGTKLAIQNMQTGNFIGDKNVTNGTHTSAYVYLPRGNYEVVAWTYTQDLEDGPAVGPVAFKIKPNIPKHPTTYTIVVN